VGLPFTSEVAPCLVDFESAEGPSKGRHQRITKVDVNLYESVGFTLGMINEDGETITEDIPFRSVSLDSPLEPIPLFTGIREVLFFEGYTQEPTYFIRQTEPLPLTVLSVTDQIEVYG